jgi:TolB-like protein/DNA-binding winged helix-turn-helix (wHTH) protein
VGAKKIGFDGWVLDPDSGDLERAGTRIRLQEQPLQVLMQLIDSRGGVVTREQLISKLWPKGIVDFDTGLNTAIRKLRVALGDTADTPRYIETLPRRGYRFIAALEPDPARQPGPTAQPQPESTAGVPTSDVPPVRTMEESPPQTAVPPRTGYVPVESSPSPAVERAHATPAVPNTGLRWRGFAIALSIVLALSLGYVLVDKLRRSKSVTVEPPATTARIPVTDKSIAVLPFIDMSDKKDQEYFAEGIAEEVLDRLAKVPGLRVVGRASSFQFQGTNVDAASVGAALGVTYLLEGSVRREGGRIRVAAQLVEARTGLQRWSDRFDSDLIDVLRVQGTIASELARAFQIAVEVDTNPRASVESPDVLDAYMRGLQSFNLSSREGCEAAVANF